MTRPAAAEPAPPSSVLTMDDRWPTAAEYPCCTPRCVLYREPGGGFEWDHEHNEACPTQAR